MNIKRNQRGFTLIEVVLVLAIGGLIFLLAFLAFQQVSVNRRDTQRRSDAARVLAELENYYGDKNAYPAASVAGAGCNASAAAPTFSYFLTKYVCKGTPAPGTFFGPKNTAYAIAAGSTTTAILNGALAEDAVRFNDTLNCDGTAGRSVQIGLEKGVACRDTK